LHFVESELPCCWGPNPCIYWSTYSLWGLRVRAWREELRSLTTESRVWPGTGVLIV